MDGIATLADKGEKAAEGLSSGGRGSRRQREQTAEPPPQAAEGTKKPAP